MGEPAGAQVFFSSERRFASLGVEPGFPPPNVRDFPDTRITFSLTVRGGLVSYY